MQRGQHLDSAKHFWSAKKATSGRQGFLGWGNGYLALPLSHRCWVNDVLSSKLLLNLTEFEPILTIKETPS